MYLPLLSPSAGRFSVVQVGFELRYKGGRGVMSKVSSCPGEGSQESLASTDSPIVPAVG
jgi:hypothetical protein